MHLKMKQIKNTFIFVNFLIPLNIYILRPLAFTGYPWRECDKNIYNAIGNF